MSKTNDLYIKKREEEERKKEWICENFHGCWELFVDPGAIYDRIAELEQDKKNLEDEIQRVASAEWSEGYNAGLEDGGKDD